MQLIHGPNLLRNYRTTAEIESSQQKRVETSRDVDGVFDIDLYEMKTSLVFYLLASVFPTVVSLQWF